MKPGWLLRHLEQTGRANTDSVSRDLTAGTCPRCRAHVLRGLDGDICALALTVDPDPVSRVGEALALITDRRTANVTRSNGRWRLHHRDPWRIRGPRFGLVLAEHRCSAPLPLADPTGPDPTRPASAAPASEECPF